MNMRLIVLAMVFILLLGGCGYHLRGAYQVPAQMASTIIRADNMNSDLVRNLRLSLEAGGINVVSEGYTPRGKEEAPSDMTVLRIFREKQSKRVLSVDANGRVREYELHYKISIEMSGAEGFFVPEQKLELSRDFLFDTEDVLGKSDEEAELIRDMQRDMVRLIMLRLQAVAQKKLPLDQPQPEE